MNLGISRVATYAAVSIVLAGVVSVAGTAAAQSAANTLRIANTVAAPIAANPRLA